MSGNVTEKDFFDIWEKVCKQKNDDLVDAWKKNASKYTDVIFRNENCVAERLKKELKNNSTSGGNWELHKEYYSCDAVYYLEPDDRIVSSPFAKSKNPRGLSGVWLKKIRIHLEHENNISSSWREISQLQTFAGELKVLVTYPDCDATDSNEISKILENYSTVMGHGVNNFLIIFGFLEKGSDTIEWKGYRWDKTNREFIDVKKQNSTP